MIFLDEPILRCIQENGVSDNCLKSYIKSNVGHTADIFEFIYDYGPLYPSETTLQNTPEEHYRKLQTDPCANQLQVIADCKKGLQLNYYSNTNI